MGVENAWKCRLASGLTVLAIAGAASMAAFAEGPNGGASMEGSSGAAVESSHSDTENQAAEDRESASQGSEDQEGVSQGSEAQENTSRGSDDQKSSSQGSKDQKGVSRGSDDQKSASQGRESREGVSQENGTQESVGQASETQEGGFQVTASSDTAVVQEISEEEVDAYFDGTVLVGDSVMLGFRNYSLNRSGTYLGRMQFLASGSFSVHNALWPVSAKSVHPVYQGQQRLVWESAGMMQPRRVFMFFGLNDMNMGSLEDTCEKYAQVIANIKANCPDAEIHIMSMTYTLRGKGRGRLNNENIRQFNNMLRQMSWDNGWGFVDLANPLADANGDLAPQYCSDNYVHQTTAAYDVWSNVLRAYARSQMDGSTDFPVQGAAVFAGKDGNFGTISVPHVEPPETAAETEENNTEDSREN